MTRGVGLRTLDAMQLATANVLKERGLRRFVTSDKRLLVAADKEGLELVDPEAETAAN
jgi:predicted nucleic acid-binding protein